MKFEDIESDRELINEIYEEFDSRNLIISQVKANDIKGMGESWEACYDGQCLRTYAKHSEHPTGVLTLQRVEEGWLFIARTNDGITSQSVNDIEADPEIVVDMFEQALGREKTGPYDYPDFEVGQTVRMKEDMDHWNSDLKHGRDYTISELYERKDAPVLKLFFEDTDIGGAWCASLFEIVED